MLEELMKKEREKRKSSAENNLINAKHAVETGLWNKQRYVKSKPVIQYDKDFNFIKRWDSVAEAERTLNIRHISSVCNRTKYRYTAGGYIWRYVDDRNT